MQQEYHIIKSTYSHMNEAVSCSAYDSNRNFQTYQPGIGINDVTTNSPEIAQAEMNSLFK